jgi:hypothetical protein
MSSALPPFDWERIDTRAVVELESAIALALRTLRETVAAQPRRRDAGTAYRRLWDAAKAAGLSVPYHPDERRYLIAEAEGLHAELARRLDNPDIPHLEWVRRLNVTRAAYRRVVRRRRSLLRNDPRGVY